MPTYKNMKTYTFPLGYRSTRTIPSMKSKVVRKVRYRRFANRVRSVFKPELKLKDTNYNTQTAGLSGNIHRLSGIAQGDDYNNREGRQALIKSVQCRIDVQANASANILAQAYRIILFRWLDRDTPAVNNILHDPTGQGQRSLTMQEPQNRIRYRILFDRTYVVNAEVSSTTITGMTPAFKTHQIYKRINKRAVYDGIAETADGQGNIYMLVIGSESNGPQYNVATRVRFYDD